MVNTMLSPKYQNHIAFSPIAFQNIALDGRLVRSATEFFIAHPDGHIDQAEISGYQRLAAEPLGLIISGHTCVSCEGRANTKQNAIWSDAFIPDHQSIVSTVKSRNSHTKIILQIGHGGMKAQNNNGNLPVYTPDNMTLTQIQSTVNAFADGALRAKACGFDGVQLHCAHMYLLSQFFYPQYNHRTDRYGGNGINRFRITLDILQAIKKKCGDSFPVFIKINGDNIYDPDLYFKEICQAAEISLQYGMEGMEISGYYSQRPEPALAPYFTDVALQLKEHTDLPIMQVGGIRTKEDIESILSRGIKTVSFCRPLLRDPAYITHLFRSESDS